MKKLAIIALLMLCGTLYADQIPSLKTWVASESYKAADMNANFAKVKAIVNGLLREDNFPSGFSIPASWVAHLTWPSHGSSHAAAGTDPLATDSTYLVGNIAATNATFTNMTAAKTAATNATFTTLDVTGNTTLNTATFTNVLYGGNIEVDHGVFAGNLSATVGDTTLKTLSVSGDTTLAQVSGTNATFTTLNATSNAALGALSVSGDATLAQVSGTNATFTTLNVSGNTTLSNATFTNLYGGNIEADHGAFAGNLSAAGNATFSRGVAITGADDSGYSLTIPYPGLARLGAAVYSGAGNFGSLSASSAMYIEGNATFTASASFAFAHVASLSADQVQVASLTTNSRLTVGGNLYMSGAGNVVLDGGYLDMDGALITNVGTPSAAIQAANKGYVDAAIGVIPSFAMDAQNQVDVSSDAATIPSVMLRELGSSSYTLVDYIASYTNPSSTATKTVQVFIPMQYYWYNSDTTAEVIHYYRLRTTLVASGAYRESSDVAISASTDYLDLAHFYEILQDDASGAPHPAKGFSGRATLIGVVRVPPSGTVGFGLISAATVSGYATTPYGFYYYVPQCGAKIVAW